MKRPVNCVIVLFAAVLLLTGCATRGYQTAETANKSMLDVKSELVAAKSTISKSVIALNDLVNNPKPDLKPQYEAFAKAVEAVDNHATTVRDRATDMRAKREEYVTKWRKEVDAIKDPGLKQRAMARIGQAQANFDKISNLGQTAKDAFTPFQADITDLYRYLGSDLTTGGINSVKDLIDKVRSEEAAVQKALDALIAEVDRVSTEMAAAKK